MPSTGVKQRLAEDVALWQADGIIDAPTRETLQARYDTPGFGLTTAVKYLGITGGMFAFCGLLGLVAALAKSQAFGSFLLLGIGVFFSWGGLRLGRDARARYVHSSKVVLALGVISWAAGVGMAADAAGMRDAGVAFVIGLGVVPLTFVIAYRERNGFLLFLGTIGVIHWIGSWNRMFGRSTYSVGVDEPRVMAVVAAAVFALGLWHQRKNIPGRFHVIYETVGLIYLNLSLLLLSIDPRDTAPEFIVVFTAVALGQIVLGARLKSPRVMGFGVTAVAVDMFTRYFERMWDRMNSGLFFVAGGILMMAFGFAVERAYRRWSAP